MTALKTLCVVAVVIASTLTVVPAHQTVRNGRHVQPVASVRKPPRAAAPIQPVRRYPVDDIRNVNPYFYKGPCWSGGCAAG